MKKVLIILLILSLAGAAIATVMDYSYNGNIPVNRILMLLCILLINVFCANYLYKRASIHKVEWALFGFLGNINALFIFWILKDAIPRWKKGKSFFS